MKQAGINFRDNQIDSITKRIVQFENLQQVFFIVAMIIVFLLSAQQYKAQSWDMRLNAISPATAADFGTSSNDPINFYTAGQNWMSLGTTGVLKINTLAGIGNRFLQTDRDGNIFTWNGSEEFSNQILFGDGTFRPNLISVNKENMSIPLRSKFGLGTDVPSVELDVVGDARTSNNFTVGNKLHIGGDDNYGLINYTAATFSTPAIFNFRAVGGGNGGGNDNNGGGNDDPDPLPNTACINGQISTVNLFSNMLTVKSPPSVSNIGNINIGHNGSRAFIESQGAMPSDPNFHPGNLFVNAQCNRNVYFFADNGNSFATALSKIISINGRVNVTDLMQIGHPTFTNFVETASKLYVYASGIQDGVKLRHGGASGGAGFRAIELSDDDKGFSVYRGTQNSDGTEMFSVQGDGLTVISPINSKALSIQKSGNETFSIDKDGYTEIKVYSASGMPSGRALTVKDMGTGRDLFAIKSNGKIYAREVEISLAQTFPDYVFDDTYKLASLKSLENFITENKHLPGYKKGAYYEKNGININEMLIKQQEKIEELTLYLIQLEKKVEQFGNK